MLAEGHKREAKEMIPKIMKEYSYLEREDIPEDYDILLTDYIDHWLAIKKTEVETSTYQIYCYKTNTLKEYFKMNRVMVRKVTPGIVDAFIHYELEYGKNSIEVHKDAFKKGAKVLIVDDLLATGGTAGAMVKLVKKLGAEVYELAFLIELVELNGRELLKNYSVYSQLQY